MVPKKIVELMLLGLVFFFFTRKGDDPENLRFIEYHKLKIINFINLTK